MPLTAADVMTREVITVTPATPIAEFARICADDRISGAPVVSVDGRLVGVVSKTDLLPRLLEGSLSRGAHGDVRAIFNVDEDDAVSMPDPDDAGEEDLGAVEDIMQAEVVTVAPAEPVASVARRMARERIHRVLVVEGRRLVGIITSLDLLGHFAQAPAGAGAAAKGGKAAPKAKPKPGSKTKAKAKSKAKPKGAKPRRR